MYDHITLRVKDVDASARFYRALLEPLGHVLDASGGIGPKGAPALWLVAHPGPNGGVHVAFTAKDRKAVDVFHAAGLKAGARDNGKPGPRPDYGQAYYAAFLVDPDGNNVEAVCLQ
jgi:catechol 2,3-dioxygenase-like lactoylglutathione lyase family enzyme